jgi:hypothetical protein
MSALIETITVELVGLPPGLLQDNGDRADPDDPIALLKRQYSATKAKLRTESQRRLIETIDFAGGLYGTEEGLLSVENDEVEITGFGQVCVIPSAVEAMLVQAAAMRRMRAKAQSGFLLEGPFPLHSNGRGPLTVEAVFAHRREYTLRRRVRTGTGTSRQWIIANRPLFREWSIIVKANYFPSIIEKPQVIDLFELGGRLVGLGSYRPKYGRFEVRVLSSTEGEAPARKAKAKAK